jgi:GTPase
VKELAASVAAGDAVALAKAITLVEDGTPRGEEILATLFPRTGRAAVIGITGPPGVGKSTLVNGLIALYRSRGRTLGVIAVDPSSAFSGGAILGDRIRMQQHTLDPRVFIRSMATRGHFGGLSRACRDTVDLMDASGRDPILIETVGVGQDEVDVVRVADTVMVVLTPGQGDDIQAIKAGILEIADLFVVNKADHPGADRLVSDLEAMLSLGEPRRWSPPVVMTVATEGKGIEAIADAVDRHGRFLREGDRLAERRRTGLSARFLEILRDRLLSRIVSHDLGTEALSGYEERLASRKIDPYSAAREALGRGEEAVGADPATVLDHVGVAVRRIDERLALYRDLLGLELARAEPIPGEGARVAILPAGQTRIELVEPSSKDTPVARFLDKHGEGIHHLCFEVADLDATVGRLEKAGLRFVGAAGRPGSEGSRIAFLHPKSAGGVLIELREKARSPRKPGQGRA